MVNTQRIDPDNPSIRGLLDDSQEYEVECVDCESGEWSRVRVRANHHTFTDGVLEFWRVVDNVFYLVRGLPTSNYGPYRPVQREAEDISEVSNDIPTVAELEPREDVVEFMAIDLAPPPSVDRQENLRQKVRDELKSGKFPSEGGTHHKQLQDIWEGKGDPDPDAYGLVTRPHENLAHDETLEDIEDENRAYWPTGADPDELERWIAQRNAADERQLERLRAEDDASRDESKLPDLPAHLNPTADVSLNLDHEEGGNDLPAPPYSDTNPVYTTMVGSDGTMPKRSDRDGVNIEAPDAVKAYAARVGAEPNPFITTVEPGGRPRLLTPEQILNPNPEIVEPWHGQVNMYRDPS